MRYVYVCGAVLCGELCRGLVCGLLERVSGVDGVGVVWKWWGLENWGWWEVSLQHGLGDEVWDAGMKMWMRFCWCENGAMGMAVGTRVFGMLGWNLVGGLVSARLTCEMFLFCTTGEVVLPNQSSKN